MSRTVRYDDDGRASISGRTVRISNDERKAFHTRPKWGERHPDADISVPHKKNRNLVVDIILLATFVCIPAFVVANEMYKLISQFM